MGRPPVLLIAEAANPEFTSVPLVGWSLATAIQRLIPGSHIVTQVRNRGAFLRAGMREGQDFTAIDTERLAAPAYRLSRMLRGGAGVGWTTNTAISSMVYPYFEKLTWDQFGSKVKDGTYPLVHRITPVTPTANSPVASKVTKAGGKFVLGPINGGVPWPRQFDQERRAEKEWLSYIRGAYKFIPGRNITFKNASRIFCGSRYTMGEVPSEFQEKCVWQPENAVDPVRFNSKTDPFTGGVLRVVFVGRLVPYKGADMLIEAAAPLLKKGCVKIEIVGDGPAKGDLEQQIDRLGVADSVTLHGFVAHTEVQEILARNHVLGFPSIREFGGAVVLEAMAVGVVPLVVDYTGPGELVTDATGVKVPLGDRGAIVNSFRTALDELQTQPYKVAKYRAASLSVAQRDFTWDRKAQFIAQHYDEIINADLPRPLVPA